jgi:hypothetical protein
MSFANLKKQSSLGSLTQKLVKEVEKMNSNSSGGDDRLWKPEMDKTGNGYAVIRFLPAPDGEDLPWVKMYSHGFQGPGGWYIENSLTTIGQKDPVSEHNRTLWNSGIDSDKDTVRKQKRKLSYYANIYVVKDPANPSNDGNVFLFKFGKKIFDKIMAAMQPEFEDESPINPFDLWEGANFKLKIKKVAGYWNYDSSEFDRQTPLLDDDDVLEAIWKKEHPLAAMTATDQFKTYEQLQTRLDYVLGRKGTPRLDPDVENEDNMRGNFTPSFGNRQEESELPTELKKDLDSLSSNSEFNSPDIMAKSPSGDGDEDAMSYFQRLAES